MVANTCSIRQGLTWTALDLVPKNTIYWGETAAKQIAQRVEPVKAVLQLSPPSNR